MTLRWLAWVGLRAIVTSAVVLGLGSAAAAASRVGPAAGPGSQLWVSGYSGPFNGFNVATAIAASPDGKVVFATGRSEGANNTSDYGTVAYDSGTGAQLWASRLSRLGGGIPRAIAVSPDGGTVYLTGQAAGSRSLDYMTIVYDAAAGAREWLIRNNGRAGGNDQARMLAVSPDGRTIYVTGRSQGRTSGYDVATVAYNAATGARRWVSRYNGPANLNDFGTGIAVGPWGQVVYVTGGYGMPGVRLGWAMVAYKSSSGRALWTRRSAGWSVINNVGSSIGVTPNGQAVLVANYTAGTSTQTAYQTTAYNARTGTLRWSGRYAGPAENSDNLPSALGISPHGTAVCVTGTSGVSSTQYDFATVAYRVGWRRPDRRAFRAYPASRPAVHSGRAARSRGCGLWRDRQPAAFTAAADRPGERPHGPAGRRPRAGGGRPGRAGTRHGPVVPGASSGDAGPLRRHGSAGACGDWDRLPGLVPPGRNQREFPRDRAALWPILGLLGWLVTILSFWIPFQIIGDLLHTSRPSWSRARKAWLPMAWWVTWTLFEYAQVIQRGQGSTTVLVIGYHSPFGHASPGPHLLPAGWPSLALLVVAGLTCLALVRAISSGEPGRNAPGRLSVLDAGDV
jgi:DNA-binding beta-propeller fold protein YncE